MQRRIFILGLASLMAAGAAEAAEHLTKNIVRQLQRQGFDTVTVNRTLLGRTRIVATAPQSRREIILNPRTGEILRDFWQGSGGGGGGGIVDTSGSSNSGSGSSNSGSGSSGSGSGSSGSGSGSSGSGSGSSGSGSGSSGSGSGEDDGEADDHGGDSESGQGRGRGRGGDDE
jgi:hypothetical protein